MYKHVTLKEYEQFIEKQHQQLADYEKKLAESVEKAQNLNKQAQDLMRTNKDEQAQKVLEEMAKAEKERDFLKRKIEVLNTVQQEERVQKANGLAQWLDDESRILSDEIYEKQAEYAIKEYENYIAWCKTMAEYNKRYDEFMGAQSIVRGSARELVKMASSNYADPIREKVAPYMSILYGKNTTTFEITKAGKEWLKKNDR